MRATERRVFYYDLLVGKRADHAHFPTMRELTTVWQRCLANNQCTYVRDSGNLVYRVRDIRINSADQLVVILIDRADKFAPDAAYSDTVTGELTVFEKSADQAGSSAAHIVISLSQESSRPNVYLTLLENAQGLSHRLVQPVLNSLLREACKFDRTTFQYEDPAGARTRDGNPKRHTFTPRVELRGHPSTDLNADIERGEIQHLELVKDEAQSQLAGDPYLVESKMSLKVGVDKSIPSDGRVRRLIKAMQSKKTDFSKGRVSFRDPIGQTRTVDFDLDTGAPEQQRYIKSSVVDDIDPPLAQSTDLILPRLCDPMIDLLKTART